LALAALLLWPAGARALSAGIDRSRMDGAYARQRASSWCWAACLQMLFDYYGFHVDQARIVRREFGMDLGGRARNTGAAVGAINGSLRHWLKRLERNGLAARFNIWKGAPSAQVLLWELQAQRPVLIACDPSPWDAWQGQGHAMLVIGADYSLDAGGRPRVNSLLVKDPAPRVRDPRDPGTVTHPAADLLKRVRWYWTVEVSKDMGSRVLGGPSARAAEADGSPQTLWDKGPGARWWGEALGVDSNNQAVGDSGTATIADPVQGSRTLLCYVTRASSSPGGYVGGLAFHTLSGAGLDAGSYYATGRIQFDIMLGPAFDPATDAIKVFYGDGSVGCGSQALGGLSAKAFTHVSLPFADFGEACDATSLVNYLTIADTDPGGRPGVQFYVDKVRVTPE